jgi:hypothetical protein
VRKPYAIGILLAVLLTFSVFLFVWLGFRRLEIGPTPTQATDIMAAIKGTMGQTLFDGKRGPDASRASSSANQKGLIDAYRGDPAKFKHYAELFDTAMNAKEVGESLDQQHEGNPLPETSDRIGSLDSGAKLDAWGHAFCIVDMGTQIAVVSGGPMARSSNCSMLRQSLLADRSEATFHELPSGAVVVLIARKAQNSNS